MSSIITALDQKGLLKKKLGMKKMAAMAIKVYIIVLGVRHPGMFNLFFR
jgi:hypothetical protein